VALAFNGAFQSFQWPAFSAAITTMLPKEQYSRANGLMSLAEAGSGILGPILAGALLGLIGLYGILWIDVCTFLIAIGALLLVHVPQPRATSVGEQSRGSLLKESLFGFSYILKRPGLLGLQIVFMLGNLFSTIAYNMEAPMVLARTGNNTMALATVNSAGAIGGLVGGVVMSTWGGPKRKVHGVFTGWGLASLFGTVLMGVGPGLVVWVTASFLGASLSPLINTSNQTIWQAKVAPDVQGKVFSIRRLIAWFVTPLAMLIAGPLADLVMEPAMQSDTQLAATFGPLVGTSPGSGMALIMIWMGICTALVGFGAYLFPVVREVEQRMADYEGAGGAAELQEEREEGYENTLDSTARQVELG
jgi:MFS family permease